ncbi:hypothetical protein BDV95DRAFT_596320 [Massariosphaeria phaeospora]|uniref:Uncharacterized protein n=1 Tax=Massariosphaeria phaeospora TaxID=100035 RepID=A0A7C8IAK5_9PLEO|nr:hypothetical protein BDV95DRAFT_596320 [Massariosphaeria phaeospora]
MEPFNPNLAHHKPQPFRANLLQPSSPSRVITDPETSGRRAHLHSLHHHSDRHHHHRRSRHAKEAVQSAIQLHPPTSFGDLLKQASRSKDNSPSHSRRESNANVGPDKETSRKPVSVKPVRPEDVSREREIVKASEGELRLSLQNLSDQSLKTSRRLDDTYYSILEKISVLRQTIGSLQDLSGLTKELHKNFTSDAEELVDEIHTQFEGFNDFGTQQEQVVALEERISVGKEKSQALNKRLAKAKERVEARAKAEAEWDVRTTRRFRVLWSVVAAIAGMVLLLMLFSRLRLAHHTEDSPNALDFAARAKLPDAPIPDSAKEAIIASSPTTPSFRSETSEALSMEHLENDQRLRSFDEL